MTCFISTAEEAYRFIKEGSLSKVCTLEAEEGYLEQIVDIFNPSLDNKEFRFCKPVSTSITRILVSFLSYSLI